MIKHKSLLPRINQPLSHNKRDKPDLRHAQMPIPPLKNWLLNAAQGAITGSQSKLSPVLWWRYINSTINFQSFWIVILSQGLLFWLQCAWTLSVAPQGIVLLLLTKHGKPWIACLQHHTVLKLFWSRTVDDYPLQSRKLSIAEQGKDLCVDHGFSLQTREGEHCSVSSAGGNRLDNS